MDRWQIVQACQERVLRAAACVDNNDAASLADCFSEQAVLTRPNAEPLNGREAIRLAYERRPADRMTRHIVTNLLVDVETTERVRVRSYVLLWTASKADPASADGRRANARELVGEFDDQLVRDPADAWLIERRDARFVLYRDV